MGIVGREPPLIALSEVTRRSCCWLGMRSTFLIRKEITDVAAAYRAVVFGMKIAQ
jgi:hypothetical protein